MKYLTTCENYGFVLMYIKREYLMFKKYYQEAN